MADCTNGIEIEKNLFHIQANVSTKLFEFSKTLNRTVLNPNLKNRISIVIRLELDGQGSIIFLALQWTKSDNDRR